MTYYAPTALLKLKFPFMISDKSRKSIIDLPIERKLAYVSFALPYDIFIHIYDAELKKKEYKGVVVLYVFEFSSLDAAINWMESPEVDIEYGSRNGNAKEIEDEVNNFMNIYEANEKKMKRKKLVVDEDGFSYYE